jgi:hypothetical protein
MGLGSMGIVGTANPSKRGHGEEDACDVDGEPRKQRADQPLAEAHGLLAAVRSHRYDRGGLRIGKPQLAGARRQVHVPLGAEFDGRPPARGRLHCSARYSALSRRGCFQSAGRLVDRLGTRLRWIGGRHAMAAAAGAGRFAEL